MLPIQLLFISPLFMTTSMVLVCLCHNNHRTGIIQENTHPFVDEILLQSLTQEAVAIGFVLRRKRRCCGLHSTVFYLPYCCFRDWLVDGGELGLKC